MTSLRPHQFDIRRPFRFRDELAMLESRDQGKPFINAKMIDVPGSAQVRFRNDAFTVLSDWPGSNNILASF